MSKMDFAKKQKQKNSCQDHISSLYALIENRKVAIIYTYTCSVDFKKAFDYIPRELLWRTLIKIGIRGKLLKSLPESTLHKPV